MIEIERVTMPCEALERERATIGRAGTLRLAYEGFLLVGGMLVVILVCAGIVSSILQLIGFNLISSTFIGLACGAAIVGIREWIERARERQAKVPRQLSDGPHVRSIDVIHLQNIRSAWTVSELEDFGPGYVIKTEEGEWAYCCGQPLEEIDEFGSFPESLHLHVNADTSEILETSCAENVRRVSVSGDIDIRRLPVDVTTGFVVLDPRTLPAELTRHH